MKYKSYEILKLNRKVLEDVCNDNNIKYYPFFAEIDIPDYVRRIK